ncbi:AAA family ATPase [Rhodanobacter sp. Root561]|uniref:AAA family ATPase n=1 Tax=Rhodanobacter sp. Root561 TaxID=1736560 RepID=UPI0009E898DC|nr:AAA family ATPase [Rhodanobacter sp. Root561]
MEKILLLSGAIGAGKSSVAKALGERYEFQRISSSGYLKTYGEKILPGEERHQLQNLGDRLDEETDFIWIVRDVAVPAIERAPEIDNWLLDAVRKPRQVMHFREYFGPKVHHIHLTAPEDVLKRRYRQRADPDDTSYEEAIKHSNEIAARSLKSIANEIFDTTTSPRIE